MQAEADARRGPVPGARRRCSHGPASVETYTVLFDRNAPPTHGVVIARAEGGGARADGPRAGEDTETPRAAVDKERSPVGAAGTVRVGRDGLQEWRCR